MLDGVHSVTSASSYWINIRPNIWRSRPRWHHREREINDAVYFMAAALMPKPLSPLQDAAAALDSVESEECTAAFWGDGCYRGVAY